MSSDYLRESGCQWGGYSIGGWGEEGWGVERGVGNKGWGGMDGDAVMSSTHCSARLTGILLSVLVLPQ